MFELRFKIFGFRFTLGCESGTFLLQIGRYSGVIKATKYKEYVGPFRCEPDHSEGMKQWLIYIHKYSFDISFATYFVCHDRLDAWGILPKAVPSEMQARLDRGMRRQARA